MVGAECQVANADMARHAFHLAFQPTLKPSPLIRIVVTTATTAPSLPSCSAWWQPRPAQATDPAAAGRTIVLQQLPPAASPHPSRLLQPHQFLPGSAIRCVDVGGLLMQWPDSSCNVIMPC